MCVYRYIAQQEYLLDLITNNEQLKQIIPFSKFLLWKIWSNFITASDNARIF